ncbi:Uncharacterized protein Adt_10301 [Abeliophyllum distichum]|uniref:Uncharacterized protein n=1 Tax=Abeliophyllum distichum TaxID=126358 RepID=A0ABD1UJZ5_9LAMI
MRKERQKAHAACWLQLSMFQTCKMTPDRDLTHDMKAIQKQVINISFSSHRYLQEIQYLFRLIIFCPKYCHNCYFKYSPEVVGGVGGCRRSWRRLSPEVEEVCGGGKLVERKYG